ncbi:MAG TPA: Rieske 2Fe-2S domain-containing protein [Chloroflexia bacterium]|nr:Rieske 2Fe-2S domain-containing protein [Chloroflexia bacterium]
MASSLLDYRKQHPRLTNQLGFLLFSLAGCVVSGFIGGPDQSLLDTLSLGTGYVALLLVLLTLLIGPINMLKKRKNPVNIMFRRDAGIWAGITAIFHMVFSLMLYFGGNLLLYFFKQDGSGLAFSFDLFNLSNDLGLIAGLVILFLLVLSNNYFLKMFKGPKWKQLQRFNYLLFVVALLHTFGQQITNSRNLVLTLGVMALAGIVVVAQSIGFVVYRRRDQQRKAGNSAAVAASAAGAKAKIPTSVPNLPLQPAFATISVDTGMGRRRFLLVTGTVMLSGVVGGMAGGISARVMANGNETETVATGSSGNAPGAVANSAESAATTSAATQPVTNSPAVATTSPATTGVVTTAAATDTTAPAATTTATATTAATAAAPAGTVLATIASLAAGKAIAITTPDTKEAAFVVHRQDGSVACFSGICTHEPVKLIFQEASQTLYCPRHGVPFNTQTGSPERGPARVALAKYNVTVDGQGRIIYG